MLNYCLAQHLQTFWIGFSLLFPSFQWLSITCGTLLDQMMSFKIDDPLSHGALGTSMLPGFSWPNCLMSFMPASHRGPQDIRGTLRHQLPVARAVQGDCESVYLRHHCLAWYRSRKEPIKTNGQTHNGCLDDALSIGGPREDVTHKYRKQDWDRENIIIRFRRSNKAMDILHTRGCNSISDFDYHLVPTRKAV